MRHAIVVALLGVALAGCSASDDDIRLGLLLPLTGESASQGEDARNGALLAIEQINADGGILDRKVTGIQADTRSDVNESLLQFDLLAADDVDFVIGPLDSDKSVALRPRAAAREVVLMSPASNGANLTGAAHGYFYRTVPSDLVQGQRAAGILFQEFGHTRVLFMYEATDYATGLKDVVVEAYRGLGGTTVGQPIVWTNSTAEERASMAVMQGPPFIYVAGEAPSIATMIDALREAGYSGGIMTGDALESGEIFEIAPEAVDGVYFTKPYLDTDAGAYRDFVASYQARFGLAPGASSVYAYDAVYVAKAAIEGAGKYDGPAIKAWLDGDNAVDDRASASSIRFVQGDIATGDYVLWIVDSDTATFRPVR